MHSSTSSTSSAQRAQGLTPAIVAVLSLASAAILTSAVAVAAEPAETATEKKADDVATLGDVDVTEDPMRVLPSVSSSSTFGFDKPLLETPRSVSFISSDVIERVGLSAVEDLARVAPGVFTTTRFGVQGGIDVRNVSADMYFRGMKRVTLQGNGRSVLAAMDSIEIVKGPPSPIFGMGRIGGYTNMYPKSGRAKTGAYLLEPTGFAQAITGSYRKTEFSGGVGGPVAAFGKQGGYFVYALDEDSEAYYRGVPVKQRVLQASTSLDNFVGSMRMETGGNFQISDTAGALTGRFNQGIVDSATVVTGSALKNLDANNNGVIGFLEMHSGSPVRGTISANNQPLIQTWNWQRDGAGNYRKLSEFEVIPGIPQTLLAYLNANPTADPTGLVRAAGALGTGPQPSSGQVPIGMALDPRTTGYATLDLHRAAAYEREQHAEMTTAYIDLINDSNPDFTYKNQLFFDQLDQFKISQQPGCCKLRSNVVEDKFTITKQLSQYMPGWLRVNSLASANVRYVVARNGGNAGNDYGTHRSDPTAITWVDDLGGMTPNTTFATAFDNPDLNNDGNPWGRDSRSTDLQTGVGVQFDIDMFSKLNVLVGGRWDGSKATNIDKANGFNNTTGTSASPGAFYTVADEAEDYDTGISYSVSVSYQLPWHLRPYLTYANSSVALDGNNNTYSNTVLRGPEGHIGAAYLKEIGFKADLLGSKLFFTTAVYEQNRTEISAVDPSDPSLGTDATSTLTRGWEMEIKAVPFKGASASFYTLSQKTVYNPNNGGTMLVDARVLGFQDIKDATGRVIYPAEAFLYGGRSRLVLPAGLPEYRVKQGNPPVQMGINLDYQSDSGYGVTASGNYFASTFSGRLRLVKLPEAYTFNVGVNRNVGKWEVKASVDNVFDRLWFRARTGDTLGDSLAQVMPDRKFNFTAKFKF
jgi:iron complex outermembrane receptor protein